MYMVYVYIKIMCMYIYSIYIIYFKELAHGITGAVKSKIHSTGWKAGDFEAGVTKALRQNIYFLRENSVLLLRPFN